MQGYIPTPGFPKEGTFDSPGLPPGGFLMFAFEVPHCRRELSERLYRWKGQKARNKTKEKKQVQYKSRSDSFPETPQGPSVVTGVIDTRDRDEEK